MAGLGHLNDGAALEYLVCQVPGLHGSWGAEDIEWFSHRVLVRDWLRPEGRNNREYNNTRPMCLLAEPHVVLVRQQAGREGGEGEE